MKTRVKSFLGALALFYTTCSFGQIDSSSLNNAFGKKGMVQGNVYRITFPRSDLKVTGDFVLVADEVDLVVKALTENEITVTAIHNHMLYDDPHLFMLHFWAVGNPDKLASGLKAALDKTNSKL